MEVYERTVRYDEHEVGRAARPLFAKTWRPCFPYLLPAVLMTLSIVALISIRYPAGRWVGVISTALIVLNVVWWPGAYRRYRRRLMTFWRGDALLRITSEGLSVRLDQGQGTLTWSMVQEIFQDSNTLSLFVSRSQIVVIPTDGIPDSVLQSVKNLVQRHSPVGQPQ
jgi:hypothetical protein